MARRVKRLTSKSTSGKVSTKEDEPSLSTQDAHPLFALEHLDGDYCLQHCDKNEKAALAERLHELARLTWGQIGKASRHGQGFEKITFEQLSGVPGRFKERPLIAFRFSGKKPMIGFREKEIFYILALDRNFTCYRH
jgi:hypothetical protein